VVLLFTEEKEVEIDDFSSRVNRSLLHVLISKLYREKIKNKADFKNNTGYSPKKFRLMHK
jgi:hypothetical protein